MKQLPCLAYYKSKNHILTTDASMKGVGVTLRQKQKDGNLNSICQKISLGRGKEIIQKQIELLAVVWGLEHFRLNIYSKRNELLNDHQSLGPLIERNRSKKTYSAISSKWLDRLDWSILTYKKHVAEIQ